MVGLTGWLVGLLLGWWHWKFRVRDAAMFDTDSHLSLWPGMCFLCSWIGFSGSFLRLYCYLLIFSSAWLCLRFCKNLLQQLGRRALHLFLTECGVPKLYLWDVRNIVAQPWVMALQDYHCLRAMSSGRQYMFVDTRHAAMLDREATSTVMRLVDQRLQASLSGLSFSVQGRLQPQTEIFGCYGWIYHVPTNKVS